ncbi:MAG: PspA/IM30 family protein [Spirochaetales bacterium]|jgi:phage shock protein A|nr:PspA/IM30 family protein [Spirochaetales bacterium]
MGVFTRFKDIVSSNINSLLDKAEEPEKMIRLMIQEMEDTMVELKANCAEKLGALKSIDREKGELEGVLKRWEGRAKLAVSSGKDDLAREALHEKQVCLNQMEILKKDKKHLETLVKESQDQILLLETKLEEVNQKHRLLIQRGVHARDTTRTRNTLAAASGRDSIRRFDEMERRIERMEAEAELAGPAASGKAGLEKEFSRMEKSQNIEDELAALKEELGGAEKREAKE